MSAPSVLLKQHIGTVERKIASYQRLATLKPLQEAGLIIIDGVKMSDPLTGFQYTPYAVSGNIATLKTPPEITRISNIYKLYVAYLADIDNDEIRAAMELEKVREQLHEALLDEELRSGGELWSHTADEGVFKLNIVARSQTAISYIMEKPGKKCDDKVRKGYYQRMELFLTREEAVESWKTKNY